MTNEKITIEIEFEKESNFDIEKLLNGMNEKELSKCWKFDIITKHGRTGYMN